MNEFTLLTRKQCLNSDNMLELLKKRGTIAPITDFSILLGGYVNGNYHYNNSNSLEDRAGCYWTISETLTGNACLVNVTGEIDFEDANEQYIGNRPVIPYSSISNMASNIVKATDEIIEIEYGEYPQKVASKNLQVDLEDAYIKNQINIQKTGKTYTIDLINVEDLNKELKPQIIEEYEYDKKKYVRVKNKSHYDREEITLSNGEKYKNEDYVWVEVQPIKWLIDKNKDTAISEKILFAGIQFDNKEEYDGNFTNTNLKKFMNNYFSKEIKRQQHKKTNNENKKHNIDLMFLTEEQCFDSSRKLEILEKRGTIAPITDFSILLGGYVSNDYYNNGNSLEDRSGIYWTSSNDKDKDARVVLMNGLFFDYSVRNRYVGARPALPYSSIRNISSNGVRGRDGILEVEYGEYPQKVASKRLQDELERAYNYNQSSIRKTGKTYTTDSRKCDAYDEKFNAQVIEEYSFDDGKKYVRVKANLNYDDGEFKLSNGERYKDGDYVWVEVQPIKWLIDEKSDIALSERLLFAGVQFKHERNYKGDFRTTDIKEFMDRYLSKDIIPSFSKELTPEEKEQYEEEQKRLEKRKNPYELNFGQVSEEDIIKGAIESGVAVFLHGPSSEGKSARVKQIDPDCVIIYLRNATPESLNGKSVYNSETGEMIDVKPTWLKKLEDRCEKEPNKNHIVFLDEITNALPSIQGIAFNIVLDREVNGIWQLPKNARIVAAGNDMNDSLAANQLAEPLFNRFAHVYIKTSVESWLKWASEHNIHPAIYAYIAYKKGESLRSKYDGEKPNADPRKWEMASKMLYKTGQPEMLRALIGEDITKEFIEFCNQQVITLEDVLNDNYTESDLQMNTSALYATTVGLTQVDEENFEKVREFVSKLGQEFCAIFDTMWMKGDEKRMEIVTETRLEKSIGGKRL